MKVFVATSITQGKLKSDFTDCVEGELVWMLEACPESRRDPDGECGCGRSFDGMNSHGSTTTALVRDIPDLSIADYTEALRASFDAQGWCSCCTSRNLDDVVTELVDLADEWPEGAVIERRLDRLGVRTVLR